MTTRRQKADAVTSRLNTTAVSGRSGAKLMRVIPQREPGGELYVRPGTSALLNDSLHNMSNWPKSGGGERITLASPHYEFWGDASPRPPGVYAYGCAVRYWLCTNVGLYIYRRSAGRLIDLWVSPKYTAVTLIIELWLWEHPV